MPKELTHIKKMNPKRPENKQNTPKGFWKINVAIWSQGSQWTYRAQKTIITQKGVIHRLFKECQHIFEQRTISNVPNPMFMNWFINPMRPLIGR